MIEIKEIEREKMLEIIEIEGENDRDRKRDREVEG